MGGAGSVIADWESGNGTLASFCACWPCCGSGAGPWPRAGAGGRLYARIQDVQEAIGTPDKASFFLVKGRSATEAEQLSERLQQRFKGHKITPIAQVSKVMQDNAVGLQQFKQALTGMAVVISFLVVLLAMYTTIIERTREIGILRAIGATQSKVVQLVVAESFLICLAGVVVGIKAWRRHKRRLALAAAENAPPL